MAPPGGDVARVPLQIVRGCVVASLQLELSDSVLHHFQHDLLSTLQQSRARAVILDLAGVTILDSADFQSVLRTLRMAALMGARPLLVGIRPGIAAALAELDAPGSDITACLSLQQAFDLLERPPHRPRPD